MSTKNEEKIQALSEQRLFYEYILNMLPVGLGVIQNINGDPTIAFESNRIKEMFARYEKDGLSWHQTPDPKLVDTRPILDDTGVYVEEREYPDGRVYQFTLSYYRNEDNTWSELQLVRDVTTRHQLEKALEDSKEDLERKVEERTLELRQKQSQLVQSEKMAALGGLVAGVAHEINTPLGALKSNNDLFFRSLTKIKGVIDDPGTDEQTRNNAQLNKLLDAMSSVSNVSKNALERIVKIVGSLRKFARLDQAEQDKVDIHEGLESTLTIAHHELKNRVVVHKDYGDIPQTYCFPNQINQVFINILVNAAQAIEGTGDIFIKTFTRDKNIVVEFRDTGKGIAKENLEKIFDPGFTTKGAGVGTGLGLSIVYQILKDHNGNIEADSEVGKGTTMRVVLPIVE